MDQQELREELRTAKVALHEMRLQLARYGIDAPVHLILGERDQSKHVARLEAALGQTQTEPRVLPSAPPAPRYVEPPRPAREFEQAQEVGREHARRADIEHQTNLLTIHRHNLAHLRATAKAYGGVRFAPIHVQNQMGDERENIQKDSQAAAGRDSESEFTPCLTTLLSSAHSCAPRSRAHSRAA